MLDHEGAMLAYLRLADISQRKKQLLGRDKFLILTGVAACRSGWLEVAERCRELVLAHNSAHLVIKHETFADAMRSPDVQPFLRQLERFCGYEKAEHFLHELGIDRESFVDTDSLDVGEFALGVLSAKHWTDG